MCSDVPRVSFVPRVLQLVNSDCTQYLRYFSIVDTRFGRTAVLYKGLLSRNSLVNFPLSCTSVGQTTMLSPNLQSLWSLLNLPIEYHLSTEGNVLLRYQSMWGPYGFMWSKHMLRNLFNSMATLFV